jgi:hypothetical protein
MTADWFAESPTTPLLDVGESGQQSAARIAASRKTQFREKQGEHDLKL